MRVCVSVYKPVSLPLVTRVSLTVKLPDMKSAADFNETRSNKQEQLYDDTKHTKLSQLHIYLDPIQMSI